MRGVSIALLGLTALALVLWQWPILDASPNPTHGPANTSPDRVEHRTVDRAEGATGAALADEERALQNSLSDHSSSLAREAVVMAGTPAATGEWTVQLTGIDPAVPWTAPLQLVFEERFKIDCAVEASGACRFVPPAGARHPSMQNLRLVTRDDHYRVERPWQRTDALQMTGFTEFAVYPIAQLRGRVLGPDGQGIVARVSAFLCGPDGPHEPVLGRTNSDEDGRYELRVPPGTPLAVVAEVMVAAVSVAMSGATLSPLIWDFEQPSGDDLLRHDDRRPSTVLLPAMLRTEGVHNSPRTVPDLRLDRTAVLLGRVTFADGRPLANADVIAQPAWATTPGFSNQRHWSPSDGLVRGAHVRTDARGAFALSLQPGVAFRVQATAEDPLLLGGEPSATASAPGDVELVAAGDLVTLRVVAFGQPVPRAWLDLGDLPWRADGKGQLRLTLGPEVLRVRGRAEARSSAWVELPPADRPALVILDLQVAAELAEVRLVLQSQPELLEATFAWQPLPSGAQLVMVGKRQRADAPFVMSVPAGRYRLNVRDEEAAPGGAYLLPTQLEVDVPPGGLATEHRVAFGGRIELEARDANGTRLAGTFVLRDASGRDVTPMTVTNDADGDVRVAGIGELQPLSTNRLAAVLPAGDYALTVDTIQGSIQRTVTIQAGNTTSLSLQLR